MVLQLFTRNLEIYFKSLTTETSIFKLIAIRKIGALYLTNVFFKGTVNVASQHDSNDASKDYEL